MASLSLADYPLLSRKNKGGNSSGWLVTSVTTLTPAYTWQLLEIAVTQKNCLQKWNLPPSCWGCRGLPGPSDLNGFPVLHWKRQLKNWRRKTRNFILEINSKQESQATDQMRCQQCSLGHSEFYTLKINKVWSKCRHHMQLYTLVQIVPLSCCSDVSLCGMVNKGQSTRTLSSDEDRWVGWTIFSIT